MSSFVSPGLMGPKIDAMVTLIREAVLADTKRQAANDPKSFDDAIDRVRVVVAFRSAGVAALPASVRRRAVTR